MDRFAVYYIRKDGSRQRVVASAVQGRSYSYDVHEDKGDGWSKSGGTDAIVSMGERQETITNLLTSVIALGTQPRMLAADGLDEMPVYVVYEGLNPNLALAKLHDRVQRSEASS